MFSFAISNLSMYSATQFDKIFISNINVSDSFKGAYLLYDNLSGILFFTIASINYILLPKLLVYLRATKVSWQKFLFIELVYFIITLLVCGLVTVIGYHFISLFFIDYYSFVDIFPYQLLLKLLILNLFIPTTLLSSINEEKVTAIVTFVVLSSVMLFSFNYIYEPKEYLFTVFCSVAFLFLVLNILYVYINNKKLPQ